MADNPFRNAENSQEPPKQFDVDKALKTPGLDEFLAKFDDVDAESFDPYTNPEDQKKLKERFEIFEAQKGFSKDITGFVKEHFKKEVEVNLTDAQLQSVVAQVEKMAVEDPEGFKQHLQTLKDFKTLPLEVEKSKQEMVSLVGPMANWAEVEDQLSGLKEKKKTLELAADSGFLQSFNARRRESLASDTSKDKLKSELSLKAFDKAVKHFRVPELITDKDREFIKGLDFADSDNQLEAHFKGTRFSESFVDLLKQNINEAKQEASRAGLERSKQAVDERQKAEARLEAKYTYGLALPVWAKGTFSLSKRGLDIGGELKRVDEEIKNLESKGAAGERVARLMAENNDAHEVAKNLLIDRFISGQAVSEEVKVATQKQMESLFNAAHKELTDKKGSVKAAEALKYLDQLEKAGESGAVEGLDESVKISDLTFSPDRLREILQEEIEEMVREKIIEQVEKAVVKGKPDTIALALKEILVKTEIGQKSAGQTEALTFIGGVVGEYQEKLKNSGQKVKLLNLSLAIKKLQASTRLITS